MGRPCLLNGLDIAVSFLKKAELIVPENLKYPEKLIERTPNILIT
jgi:hypothetical protein